MPNLTREVLEIAEELQEKQKGITKFEALQIAVKVQHNRILEDAYLVGQNGPTALEAIAMQLGAGDGSSIKDAIYSLKAD